MLREFEWISGVLWMNGSMFFRASWTFVRLIIMNPHGDTDDE
jgi:hypothetical protein